MNNNPFIICETGMAPSKPNIKETHDDYLVLEVVLQDADTLNRNKRIYPKKVLDEAIAAEYVQERLATKSWYGEAGQLAELYRNI